MNKGLNMQSVKNENRSLILYLLNANGSLSRKEIASKLGLTPAAVTKICAELIEKGLIRESGEAYEQGKSGRRERLLTLCLDDKLVLGVNAEKNIITLSVSSLSGRLLLKKHIPFSLEIDDVLGKSREFLESADIDKSKLIGAGVCIIGSLSENDFGIWKDKLLCEKFESVLGIPVVIENNVKAFAQSELIYGDIKNTSSVLFLKWGPGIGSAIAANGEVLSGSDSSVAEIGHYIVNTGGARCRCGRFGCLETEASEEAILKDLGSKVPLDETLKNCDNRVVNIIEHKIDMVALALANTATILNANSVVLFGAMLNNEQIAEKLIKQCLRYNSNLSGDMISISALNESSDFIGAAAICSKQFFFESEEY